MSSVDTPNLVDDTKTSNKRKMTKHDNQLKIHMYKREVGGGWGLTFKELSFVTHKIR